MRTWAIIVAIVALVLAGVFVVSMSLWTRSTLYAGAVTNYCVPPNRMERFRTGDLDVKGALAVLIVMGDQPGDARGIVQRAELSAVRRFGFLFLSHEEQLSFIAQLPACTAANTRRVH
jgi:hypothetical protein